MTIGSKSQSNDRENDLDRMEMMEDNGHEEGNIDQDGGSMETAGYVLAIICTTTHDNGILFSRHFSRG